MGFFSRKTPEAEAAPVAQKGWFARLREGMSRTRRNLTDGIRNLFSDPEKDREERLEELEALLLQADVGVEVTTGVSRVVEERLEEEPGADGETVLSWVRDLVAEKLRGNDAPMNLDVEPVSVLMVLGVNGTGKTTTVAKLASLFKAYGRKVLLVAADTFRAGAIEQLAVWADRAGVDLVRGNAGGDPSSVVFDAMARAKNKGYDLVLVDTAGRLHTQTNLMEELVKIERVIKKHVPDAPHESFLVVDATTGQNAISQAELFGKAVGISGLVLTKLDGTAKGGVVVNVRQKLSIPIRFVGVGEQMEDLRPFKAEEFTEALFT